MGGFWIMRDSSGVEVNRVSETTDANGTHQRADWPAPRFRQFYVPARRQPAGRWVAANGQDWWTEDEAENGYAPSDARYREWQP